MIWDIMGGYGRQRNERQCGLVGALRHHTPLGLRKGDQTEGPRREEALFRAWLRIARATMAEPKTVICRTGKAPVGL
jgi:hypothetical protein